MINWRGRRGVRSGAGEAEARRGGEARRGRAARAGRGRAGSRRDLELLKVDLALDARVVGDLAAEDLRQVVLRDVPVVVAVKYVEGGEQRRAAQLLLLRHERRADELT
jgi:hypothetical protein